MRISQLVPAVLVLSALGCANTPPEDPTPMEEAVLCTIHSDPSKPCSLLPPPLPQKILTLTVAPGDGSVDIAFDTQGAPLVAKVSVMFGVGASQKVISTQSDKVATNYHEFVFSGLQDCAIYWYQIEWGGNVKEYDQFSTGSPTMTFHFQQLNYAYGQVHAHTSSPAALQLTVHQAQAVQTVKDQTVDFGSGTDHYYTYQLAGPTYTFTTGCGVPQTFTYTVDEWPQHWGATYQPAASGLDYPGDATNDWVFGHELQGVAHDDQNNWLFSNNVTIYKIPVGQDLAPDSHPLQASIPPALLAAGYNHIGDLDFSDGIIYAPLEYKDTGVLGHPAHLLFYDRGLNYLGETAMPAQWQGLPWVAVNPIDGLLYTSAFTMDSGNGLHRFQIVRDPVTKQPKSVTFKDEVFLYNNGAKMTLPSVQGGAFSRMGHLYLVSAPGGVGDGVYGYDIAGSKANWTSYQFISYLPYNQELEGVDVWDRNDGAAPGIGGQVHVLMAQLAGDHFWFKHYDVSNPDGSDSPAGRYWF